MINKKESAKKIAIKFGDNDFGNTFLPLLAILNASYLHTKYLPKDKKKLCFLINSLSPIAYVLFQNQWEYNGLEDVKNGLETEKNKEFIQTKKYLVEEMLPTDILVDKEVDDYLAKHDWDNGETYILDTTLYNNKIYSL